MQKWLISFLFLATTTIKLSQSRAATICDVHNAKRKLRTLNYKFTRIESRLKYINGYIGLHINAKYQRELKSVTDLLSAQRKFIDNLAKINYTYVTKIYAKTLSDRRKNFLVHKVHRKFYNSRNEIAKRYNIKNKGFYEEAKQLRGDSDTKRKKFVVYNWRKKRGILRKARVALAKYSTLHKISDLTILRSKVDKMKDFIIGYRFHQFKRVRSNGISGIKKIPSMKVGAYSFDSETHCGDNGLAGINDDLMATENKVAFGPVNFILNGIDFFINSNGYELKIPSYSENFDMDYNMSLPNMITIDNLSIDEQITEIRNILRDLHTRNFTNKERNKYMAVHLSYVEGYWTSVKTDQLRNQFQYCSESTDPSKYCSSLQYLPTATIREDTGLEEISQFNYRIYSRQVSNRILKHLKVVDDVVSKVRTNTNTNDYKNTFCVRYTLDYYDVMWRHKDTPMKFTLLDKWMANAPGIDNFKRKEDIVRSFPGTSLVDEKKDFPVKAYHKIDESHYLRAYNTSNGDKHLCFSNQDYFAKTSQNEVVGPSLKDHNQGKASVAVPAEVIIASPLKYWNPYNIPYSKSCDNVTGDGTYNSPYSGTCPDIYYHTPIELFKDDIDNEQTICNEFKGVYMRKANNGKGCFVASGTPVILPKIDGIEGNVRLRYPVLPFHQEGSSEWKKLKSIWEIFEHDISFRTGFSNTTRIENHTHKIKLLRSERERIDQGEVIQIATERDNIHRHVLTIGKSNSGNLLIKSCDSRDGENKFCFDGHPAILTEQPY